mmetsp:Transcript_1630/g.4661  ORF Transcript_1630/g.4661 Transcript_1630/m.4661 type:complete len:166 (+) Transcript_1630:126-623(+)
MSDDVELHLSEFEEAWRKMSANPCLATAKNVRHVVASCPTPSFAWRDSAVVSLGKRVMKDTDDSETVTEMAHLVVDMCQKNPASGAFFADMLECLLRNPRKTEAHSVLITAAVEHARLVPEEWYRRMAFHLVTVLGEDLEDPREPKLARIAQHAAALARSLRRKS